MPAVSANFLDRERSSFFPQSHARRAKWQKKEDRLGACPRFSCSLSTVSQKKNKRLLAAPFPRANFGTKILNFVLKLVLPKGNTVNFSHFYFTFIAKIVFKSLF